MSVSISSTSRVLRLPPLPTISEIIRIYGLRAQKQLSQNFLLDGNLSRKFVRSAGCLRDAYVCEVGPGPGGITRAILESGVKQLSVVEKDARFLPSLELLREASGDIMRIHHGDILSFDTSHLFPPAASPPAAWSDPPPNLHILGNLPFAVSTPLVIRWLDSMSRREGAWAQGRVRLTLTFQKEVAERIAAPPMHRQRCRLSVMCQSFCHVAHRFTMPGSVFTPPPDVDVGVVLLTPRVRPIIDGVPFGVMEKVVRNVFHYRQKMCKRGIQTLFPPDRPELTRRMVTMAEIHPDSRPFALGVDDFGRLCHAYMALCAEFPELQDYDYRSQENAPEWRKTRQPLEM